VVLPTRHERGITPFRLRQRSDRTVSADETRSRKFDGTDDWGFRIDRDWRSLAKLEQSADWIHGRAGKVSMVDEGA
jgi:hypothetical protein